MNDVIVLGAGKHQRIEGAMHQDVIPFDGLAYLFDLNRKDWPLATGYYDKVIATHVVEHLDSLINFMNNCHRILKPGGFLYIETPNAGVNPDLEYCDPTHVRCYRPHTFINYFTLEGIEKFGYTDKAWAVSVKSVRTEISYDTMIAELTPIK